MQKNGSILVVDDEEIMREILETLLKGEGYASKPSGAALEAMDPYVEPGSIAVPTPGPTQVLLKVRLASINPSDVMFIKGLYGQPRVKGQPAGFEGVGDVVAAGEGPEARAMLGRRVAFATGLSNWGSWAEYAIAEAGACIPLLDTVRDEDGAAITTPDCPLRPLVREQPEAAEIDRGMWAALVERGVRGIAAADVRCCTKGCDSGGACTVTVAFERA